MTGTEVREQILACKACKLCLENPSVPFSGDIDSKLLVIAEAPGEQEIENGEPLWPKAPSGGCFDRSLKYAGLTRADCFLMNMVCGFPYKVENGKQKAITPAEEYIKACKPNFDAQFDLSKALVGVLMGQTAANLVDKRRISETRGNIYKYKNKVFMVTWHPSYVNRNRGLEAEKQFIQDFKKLGRMIEKAYAD